MRQKRKRYTNVATVTDRKTEESVTRTSAVFGKIEGSRYPSPEMLSAKRRAASVANDTP